MVLVSVNCSYPAVATNLCMFFSLISLNELMCRNAIIQFLLNVNIDWI